MADNVWTKNYGPDGPGNALDTAELDTAFASVQPALSQTALLTTGASAGQVLTVVSGGSAAVWSSPSDPKAMSVVRNYGLSASTSSGSLIVALKTAAGTNPTASDIVDVTFSSNGSSSAVPQKFSQTSSLTLSVTASATLGVRSATTATLYVYAVRVSSSTLRLSISTDGSFDSGAAATTVAMASTADTDGVMYSNASAGTYPVRLLGWIQASHTTGSWNAIYKVNLQTGLADPSGIANRRVRSTTSTSTSSITVIKGGVAISNSSGTFQNTSASFVDVTNLAVTLTTTGRPVYIGLCDDGSSSATFVRGTAIGPASNLGTLDFQFYRTGTSSATLGIMTITLGVGTSGGPLQIAVPPSSFNKIENVGAGTYTWKLRARPGSGGVSLQIFRSRLIAYEL